jgi:putative effector of murein hydrolase LrgA (UPF0299 family)
MVVVVENKNNTLAIVSFVTSLVNLFCCSGALFLVPVIVGILSLVQIAKTNESGKGFAIAGVTIGSLSVVWFVFNIFFGFAYISAILSGKI